MSSSLYIAVDLGAGSGRVFLAGLDADELLLEEIHRFRYPPEMENGHLRWNFSRIFDEIKLGIRTAATRAREVNRPLESIGVDSWGVDYGLLSRQGELISNPICYRDGRTEGEMERVFEKMPRTEVFERTGIQFLPFNSIFQLHAGRDEAEDADKVLLLPDLINYFLAGKAITEYTNATTTQLVNAMSGDWDEKILSSINISRHLLSKIVPAGTDLGLLKTALADELGTGEIRVVTVATHDTASAVAAAPLGENSAYISSGTWSLIGIERDGVLIDSDVEKLNFTNEGGAFGTIRFLKNVMGLWIFESCREEWEKLGVETDYEEILSTVEEIDGFETLIFPDDEQFLNPPSMLDAIANQLRETGQKVPPTPAEVSKCVFDSLAFRYSSVLRSIESLNGTILENIFVLGGGGRNAYLNRMTANASGLTVIAGLTEATVLGNVLVQAVAAGRFESLRQARRYVHENFALTEYRPMQSERIIEAQRKYKEIESRFIGH